MEKLKVGDRGRLTVECPCEIIGIKGLLEKRYTVHYDDNPPDQVYSYSGMTMRLFKKIGGKMNKFKVGDKVRCINQIGWEESTHRNGKPFVVRESDLYAVNGPHKEDFIKIGGTMSQYEDLKARINALNGWDKEADDIGAIIRDHLPMCYYISATLYKGSGWVEILDYKRDLQKSFSFEDQCSKLQAFKDALLWLLDHSDIKKTLVGTKQTVKIEGKIYEAEIIKEA